MAQDIYGLGAAGYHFGDAIDMLAVLAQIHHFLKADVDIVRIPEDLVNGVDWIGGKFRGRTCIDLDIDRQKITPFGTPADIDAHVRNCIQTIGCEKGGLMMIYGLYPGVPLENVKALMDAMTRYADFYG